MIFDQAFDGVDTLPEIYLPSLHASLVDATTSETVKTLLAPGRRRVNFMNAHCFNVMARDWQYAAAVNSADFRMPDGIGVTLAAKMVGHTLTTNLNGTDFIPELLKKAAKLGKSVFLFGSTPGTADAAANKLKHKIPDLLIAGTRDGFAQAQNTADVITDINNSGADIVLVALGVPMQELWLHRNAPFLNADLTMGVGAALDFFAGKTTRAPSWFRKAKCEWVWRLALEPHRMAERYIKGNIKFLARAAKMAAATLNIGSITSRILDITLSVFALILLSPILFLTAIAIKAESKGSILFSQTRIGKNNCSFTMIKFRSMISDAEGLRDGVLAKSDREGICFKSKSDPRITQVGRFIRRASIDELPQLINVLCGQMSIVGPRPALPSEVAVYPKRAFGRLKVKPGITGVWQVLGRADIGFERMVEMDLAYVSSRGILLDLIIMSMTFRAILSGRGAH